MAIVLLQQLAVFTLILTLRNMTFNLLCSLQHAPLLHGIPRSLLPLASPIPVILATINSRIIIYTKEIIKMELFISNLEKGGKKLLARGIGRLKREGGDLEIMSELLRFGLLDSSAIICLSRSSEWSI